jgi:hypothetical protein
MNVSNYFIKSSAYGFNLPGRFCETAALEDRDLKRRRVIKPTATGASLNFDP